MSLYSGKANDDAEAKRGHADPVHLLVANLRNAKIDAREHCVVEAADDCGLEVVVIAASGAAGQLGSAEADLALNVRFEWQHWRVNGNARPNEEVMVAVLVAARKSRTQVESKVKGTAMEHVVIDTKGASPVPTPWIVGAVELTIDTKLRAGRRSKE